VQLSNFRATIIIHNPTVGLGWNFTWSFLTCFHVNQSLGRHHNIGQHRLHKFCYLLSSDLWTCGPFYLRSEIFAFGYVRPFSYGGKCYWQWSEHKETIQILWYVDGSWRVHALGEEGMGSEFEGLSNVSAVLQTKKAKVGIATFQYDSLLQHFR